MNPKRRPASKRIDVAGLITFAAVVAIGLLLGPSAGIRAMGAWMIFSGVTQWFKGRARTTQGADQHKSTSPAWLRTGLVLVLIACGAGLIAWPQPTLDFVLARR